MLIVCGNLEMQPNSVIWKVSFWKVQKCSFQLPSLVCVFDFRQNSASWKVCETCWNQGPQASHENGEIAEMIFKFIQKNKIFQKLHETTYIWRVHGLVLAHQTIKFQLNVMDLFQYTD